MTVLASVLIPIHNKPGTLPLTVETVLRQSVADLEVILIGDGVTDDVRAVVERLCAADPRVRFLDRPKGPHHGECYRHEAIVAARSDAIFYLCDDDLLLRDHVADLLALLEDHDLVQSLNGHVTPEGEVRWYADDLSDPVSVAMHLRDDLRFNSMSVTGTAHSRHVYEQVDDPWDTTPRGWNPDHHQFRKLLRHPGARAATSHRMTALQFPTHVGGRRQWTDEERLAELQPWFDLVRRPDAQETIDRLGTLGAIAQIKENRRLITRLRYRLRVVRGRLDRQRARTQRLRARLADDVPTPAPPPSRRHLSPLRRHLFSRRRKGVPTQPE